MFIKINFQYLISYLGLTPFIFIILDKYFLFKINEEIFQNFIIYYAIIILVFIGAINWNLQKKISNLIAIYGSLPSLFAIIIIILNLYDYNFSNLIYLIILFYYFQLVCDLLILHMSEINKYIFFTVRLPLTLFISISLFMIQY